MMENLYTFIPLIFVFVFFYFFIIRPQNKQQKKIQNMRNSLQKGDKIVTIGGFYGKVLNFKDDAITLELKPDNVKVQITKAAVAEVLNREEELETNKKDNKED
ncbi:preprotein translocase subunit YajC [Alkalibaculum sp. M08DMB]|uniref:Preprotein translocase subunit YajC n=1 Tax=Alkalibaculum sporogenes TaxID=2655001 RepID=A0A6A7K520_9FIRM|nr:preprotein translocase subunit YajC [Alkalibaculum sporogenes]MPW24556.1 preprotein translocase subunit YajC [Alkalibaculum sporogenes]